jgi:hypothetical protein
MYTFSESAPISFLNWMHPAPEAVNIRPDFVMLERETIKANANSTN